MTSHDQLQIIPVILAGGTGTRLWPLSRSQYPKLLQKLLGECTAIQETVKRVSQIPGIKSPLLVANQDHRFILAEQLRGMGIEHPKILLEPCGKNTAPAIITAAYYLQKQYENPILVVVPGDHYIEDQKAFEESILRAIDQASSGKFTTLGVVPTKPETGYGYIQTADQDESGAFNIERFIEKPDRKKAEKLIETGHVYWNSGMFVVTAKRLLRDAREHTKPMFIQCCLAVDQANNDMGFVRLDEQIYVNCPSDSIDYAIIEKTDNLAMIELDTNWCDLGNWDTLWEINEKDPLGNVTSGDVLCHEVKNSYIQSQGRLIGAVGIENIILVETTDAILVAHKQNAQDIKHLVTKLVSQGRQEAHLHRREYRPWGYFDSVDTHDHFKVKRITVQPGASLSLQLHHHRSEHWVVVRGTAQAVRGEKQFTIYENESIYIPAGTKHRLSNPGMIPLEVVEVQSGSYLGEDDIIRFADKYGREDSKSEPVKNKETMPDA